MHLLAPIAAGMAGAESGTVEVYERGTVTPVTLYSDFEGTVPVANPATLDANGRAKLYVDQYARCIVKTPGGATVIDFVDGKDANAVELRSASIIGNAYVGGAAAAGNPISVEEAFNKLVTSFGSTDFNVLLASVSMSMQTALGALWRARVFDVKQYGALGDGATNDLSAINSASAAANTAGGGIVFFPPGTYNVSAGPTQYATVEFVGAGAALSRIRATSDFIMFSTTTSASFLAVRKLGFIYSSTLTAWLVMSSGASGSMLFEDCVFQTTSAATTSGAFSHTGTGRILFVRCTVGGSGGLSTSYVFGSFGVGGELRFIDCSISRAGPGGTGRVGSAGGTNATLSFFGCKIDHTPAAGSTDLGAIIDGNGTLRMHNCQVLCASGGAANNHAIYVNSATSTYLFESGNDFSTFYATLSVSVRREPVGAGAAANMVNVQRGTRELAVVQALNPNSATINCFFGVAKSNIIKTVSGSGTRAIVADANGSHGADGEVAFLAVHNDTGSSITYQWSTFFASSGSTFAVAANSVRCFAFKYILERAEWFLVSDTAGAETAE